MNAKKKKFRTYDLVIFELLTRRRESASGILIRISLINNQRYPIISLLIKYAINTKIRGVQEIIAIENVEIFPLRDII